MYELLAALAVIVVLIVAAPGIARAQGGGPSTNGVSPGGVYQPQVKNAVQDTEINAIVIGLLKLPDRYPPSVCTSLKVRAWGNGTLLNSTDPVVLPASESGYCKYSLKIKAPAGTAITVDVPAVTLKPLAVAAKLDEKTMPEVGYKQQSTGQGTESIIVQNGIIVQGGVTNPVALTTTDTTQKAGLSGGIYRGDYKELKMPTLTLKSKNLK